ncbi:sugar transferase [Marinifilum flexuosum]|uniref:sugar transferase n=1 Tax=Marinifilum flexuosum TaxID=1117708 RepID=UPI002492E46D|nr:sugar transferase [Marinifilum flexuosum]
MKPLRNIYKNVFKRIFDIFLSLFGLFISSPVLLLAVVLLAVINKGAPFFIQERPGRDGKIFKILKLKTMTDKKDRNGRLLPDIERLTKVGRVIRKLSIDELPQLINILKGEMSLIGPRPLIKEYLPLYSSYHSRRHEVLPGITGWAQVNGRQSIKLSERRDYDVWYVDNISFRLDLIIFYKTVINVLFAKDVKSGQSIDVVDDLGYLKQMKK